MEFCPGPLTGHPYRFASRCPLHPRVCFAARRATYRIAYLIDEEAAVVEVLDVTTGVTSTGAGNQPAAQLTF